MREHWKLFLIVNILILSGLLIPMENAFSAIFVDSKDVTTEQSSPGGLAFNTDGTKMFVVGTGADFVHEYACGTGFDVSTCNYSGDGERKDVSEEASVEGIAFNTDGTKMFIIGFDGDDVNEYACGTGFDVSTCNYSGDGERKVVSTEDTAPVDLAFNTDGTKMFVIGQQGGDVNEYACGTGFDVSTCNYSGDGERKVVSTEEAGVRGLAFNTDGTKMFVVGSLGDNVNEYACGTGFDVSTCNYSGDGERFDASTQESDVSGLAFNTDGTKMFVIGFGTDSVHEYTLSTGFDVSSVPTSESVETTSGGGGASKHNTKPTFGQDHKTHFQLIEKGFSFNGIPTDITHNYWTPYEKQSIKVGESNEFETKVFASQKLRVQEFLFGIPVVGEAHKAELGVEVFYDHSGKLEEIRVIQKTDIIDIDSIQIEKIKSKCRSDSSDEQCVTTQLQMKFLEPLKDSVMAMKAIDFKGRSNITYLNDGFDISGDSLNPMKTMMIPGNEKYEGLIKVTQTAKYSDVWVASDGRAFEINEYGSSKLINQTIDDKIDTKKNIDRYHSEFADYKSQQIDTAVEKLLELCPDCLNTFTEFSDSWSYDISNKEDRIEKIINLIEIEKQKATQVLTDAELETTYPNAELDTDNRPISVILAEERAMKKILAEERAYLKQILTPKQ